MAHYGANTTPYIHPFPNYQLNDLHQSMEYNGAGEPAIRTIPGGGATGQTAFGEPVAVPITPVIQLDAIYGLNPQSFETFTASTGTATTADGSTLFKVSTGTALGGYGVIRTRKVIRYRPGQGALTRFTANFVNPQDNVTLRAGFIAQEQSIMIGYNGTQFGVLRQNGGKAVIYELRLTVAAGGAETGTVTLNGTAFTVSLASGTIQQNAAAIANRSGGFAGWTVEQVGNKVVFLAQDLGPKAGSFSYSSTGTSAGTMVQVQAGLANVENWTYQSDWNIDPMDGTGASGITLDPSKINVFQINFRWLGAGEIRYAIENPETGDMIFFHHEHFTNQNTEVHTDNPSFKIGYVAANLSAGTITDASVTGASLMAAIEGLTPTVKYTTAYAASTGTISANTFAHVVSVRNRLTFNDKVNLTSMKLLDATVATDSNDPLIVYIYFRPSTFTANFQWANVTTGTVQSQDVISTTAGSFTGAAEQAVAAFVLPTDGSAQLNLEPYNIVVPPNNICSLVAYSTSLIQKVSASLIWVNE